MGVGGALGGMVDSMAAQACEKARLTFVTRSGAGIRVEWRGAANRPKIGQNITPKIDPNSLYNHPNTELKILQK